MMLLILIIIERLMVVKNALTQTVMEYVMTQIIVIMNHDLLVIMVVL